MSKAQSGMKVRVHYTGTLADGTIFDSSRERSPLEFTIGAGQVIVGFDAAVTGLEVGESRTVTMPAADAYGERRQELIMTIPRAKLPSDMDFVVGQKMMWPHASGYTPVRVEDVTATDVTFDANHELAGKDLTFAVELIEII